MTLTTRVSLFFLVAMAVALTGFSTAVWLLTRNQLSEEARSRAASLLDTLSTLVEKHDDGLEWEIHGREVPKAEKARWTAEGDGMAIGSGGEGEGRGPWLHEEKRLLWEGPGRPAKGQFSEVVLRTSASLEAAHAALRRLGIELLAVSAAIWSMAALLGRWFCRRALRPLAELERASESITGDDPAGRLPAPKSGDEIAGLASAFNGVLERLQEASERQSRFVAEASHQLRTPLTRVTGHLEVALRRERTPEEYRRTISRALDQTGRMTGMVEALLHLARPEHDAMPPEAANVEVSAFIAEIIEEWRDHPRFADLAWTPAQDRTATRVHAGLLRQAIEILLDNALKHTPPGTKVSVYVADRLIFIEDCGPGIPVAERERLFQPFQRGERARIQGVPGVGLGLALCRRIVRRMGGDVTLADARAGCRFVIRLPGEGAA